MAVPKKRKHSGEENLPEKRQKKTTEAVKSITALIRLRETKADSKVTRQIRENTTSRHTNTKPGRVITRKHEQSVTALIRRRETKADSKVTRLIQENTKAWSTRLLHGTETKGEVIITTTKPGGDKIEKQTHVFKDLISKAREKLQEKRQIDDHREADIASQRIAARLALDQITDDDSHDHLKYHAELLNLGCDFIRDQVSCLKMFTLLSRDYH